MRTKGFRRTFTEVPTQTPTLLLIERSQDSRRSFEKNFSKVALHWQIVSVADGSAAVHHMTFNGFPDLLVTSLDVPKLCAVDVVEWVRTMKSPKPVPILVYDSTPPDEIRDQLAKFSVCEYLDKTAPEPKFRTTLMRYVAMVESGAQETPTV